MKNIAVCLLLVLGLAAPAFADVRIEEILVRRQGASVNLRVTVYNPGPAKQPGPIVLTAWVRRNDQENWQQVKTWTNISTVLAHNRVSRDFFDENDPLLKQLASEGAFQVRATLSAPGAQQTEQVYSWQDNETGR